MPVSFHRLISNNFSLSLVSLELGSTVLYTINLYLSLSLIDAYLLSSLYQAVKKVRRMFKQHQIHCGSETGRGKGPDGADHDRHLPVGLQKKQNGNNEAPEKTKRRREKEKEKEVDDDERRIEGDDGENKITHEAQDSSTTMTTTTSGVGAQERWVHCNGS